MSKSLEKLLDTGAMLALFVGLFYWFGFVYYEAYFAALKIHINWVDLEYKNVLVWGSVSGIYVLPCLGAVFIVLPLLNLLFDKLPEKYRCKDSDNRVLIPYYIGAGLILVLFGIVFVSSNVSEKGKENAIKFYSSKCLLSEVKYSDIRMKSERMCPIIKTKGYWVLLEPSKDSVASNFRIKLIAADKVDSIKEIDSISDYYKKSRV